MEEAVALLERLAWESPAFSVCKEILTLGFILSDFWVLAKDPKAGNSGFQIYHQTLTKIPTAKLVAFSLELTLGYLRNSESTHRGRISLENTIRPWDISGKVKWEWLQGGLSETGHESLGYFGVRRPRFKPPLFHILTVGHEVPSLCAGPPLPCNVSPGIGNRFADKAQSCSSLQRFLLLLSAMGSNLQWAGGNVWRK